MPTGWRPNDVKDTFPLEAAENPYLQQQLEPILIGESHSVESELIHSPEMTVATYKANNFERVWSDFAYTKQALNLIAQA